MKGSVLVEALPEKPGAMREKAIFDAAIAGYLPAWSLVPVSMGYGITIFVQPDYFAIGDDVDFVRVPISPLTAQRIADRFGWSLPTPKMVDAIWKAAAVKLVPSPMGPPKYPYDATMLSTSRFVKHHEGIETLRAGRTGLIAGHKKDVVLSDVLALKPGKVAIYGWHRANGNPIQPLSTIHESTYADYSHGIRFISDHAEVNGTRRPLEALLRDPVLSTYVAGPPDKLPAPMEVTRIPGVSKPTPNEPSPPPNPELTLAEAVLAEAERDLALDIRETAPNDSPQIRALYLHPMGLVAGQNWCAAAVSMWIRRAVAATGHEAPIAGSVGAQAIMAQLKAAKQLGRATWTPRSKLKASELTPGMLVVWDRSRAGQPSTNWMGHIGILRRVGTGGVIYTIEANGPGDRLSEQKRRLDDPKLFGMGGFI